MFPGIRGKYILYTEEFMNFIGKYCPVCGNLFEENDDIVVCPDCGTPHHRECYRAEGKCANFMRHQEDFRWSADESPREEKAEAEAKVICENCGMENSRSAKQCVSCGCPLEEESASAGGMGPGIEPDMGQSVDPRMAFIKQMFSSSDENTIEDVPVREVAWFVKGNYVYYIPQFKQMAAGRKVSFNFMSFLFPHIYFANRRMWFWAVISMIVSVIFSLPVMISQFYSMGFFTAEVNTVIEANADLINRLAAILNMFDLGFRVITCLFANYIYYRFTMKAVHRIREANGGGNQTVEKYAGVGGLKILNTLLILIIAGAVSAIAIYAFSMLI